MGNFLSANWRLMYFQEFSRQAANAIASREIKEEEYLFNCIEKVSKIEKEEGININTQYRHHVLIRPIVHKLYEKSIMK